MYSKCKKSHKVTGLAADHMAQLSIHYNQPLQGWYTDWSLTLMEEQRESVHESYDVSVCAY